MKTFMARKQDVKRKWHLVDAQGKVLGRLATDVANALRGKDQPTFTPHVDTGDFVVVVNAKKVKLTGKKLDNKMYYRHTRYPGGLKSTPAKDLLQKKPEEVIKHAVRGMLPKNRLGRQIIKKLKVYPGPKHPHQAQNPQLREN